MRRAHPNASTSRPHTRPWRQRAALAGILAGTSLVGAWPSSAAASFPGANGAIFFDAPSYDICGNQDSYDIQSPGGDGADATVVVGSAYSPDVSPDGNRLVLADDRLFGEMAIAPVAHPDREKVVTHRYSDETGVNEVAWSPDGRRLVFSYRDGIATIGADGRRVRRLTRFRGDASPRWSVAGRIVFVRPTGHGRHALFSIRPDASGLRQLTTGHNDTEPDWSPDGRHLAFVRQDDGDIYIVGADGRHARRLTHHTDALGVAWSPDRRLLVYVDRSKRDQSDVFTVTRGGVHRRHIASFEDQTGELARIAWQAVTSPSSAVSFPPTAAQADC